MKIDAGRLFEYPADYKVVTTNSVVLHGRLVMGAGCAKEANARFPNLSKKLGTLVAATGNVPYICEEEGIITLPTKEHWRHKSTIELIVKSVRLMVGLVDTHKIESVVMPMPGCGHGWLDWEAVRQAIEPLLDDRFTVLTTDVRVKKFRNSFF